MYQSSIGVSGDDLPAVAALAEPSLAGMSPSSLGRYLMNILTACPEFAILDQTVPVLDDT